MGWSAGTYSRVGGSTAWGDDRDAAVEIEAGLHDTHDEDLASGINNCLAKDGQNSATADLNIGNNKLTNVTDPTSAQDAATKAYVDANVAGIIFVSGDVILIRTGASAPAGWTKESTNNKAVKIVSGTPGSDGGSVTFDAALVNARATASGGSHSHTADGNLTAAASGSATFVYNPSGPNTVLTPNHTHDITGSTSTDSGHTHNHTLAVQHREFNAIVKT